MRAASPIALGWADAPPPRVWGVCSLWMARSSWAGRGFENPIHPIHSIPPCSSAGNIPPILGVHGAAKCCRGSFQECFCWPTRRPDCLCRGPGVLVSARQGSQQHAQTYSRNRRLSGETERSRSPRSRARDATGAHHAGQAPSENRIMIPTSLLLPLALAAAQVRGASRTPGGRNRAVRSRRRPGRQGEGRPKWIVLQK